ncbi:Ras- protein Rab-18-B [Coemansia sp. S610]|nr:Ras- protein Rab-18-B [Coemansia sp. RSA 2675]KAJ2023028.1 Ras- protein Rab-18-B [Coemansia sp. S610]KAJ2414693.1 Ras- protein Rab-18-B [Coemansia sp. RSA 2530]KAJ2695532.1 Ras- protein Rab-18-B [Coemansia sp. IMI 209128]
MERETTPEIASTFKILLVGDSNVGKSSILLRFTDDHFLPPEDTSATIGVDFKVKLYDLGGTRYKLTIWDTAGQERFRTLTSSYYRGAQGVILVYDVCSRESFEHLNNWIDELNTYCSNDDIIKMVIGNKIDKESERQVPRKEGAEYARKHQTLFLECSAKTKIGVQQAVEELVNKIVETPSLWRKSTQTKGVISIDNSVTSGIPGGCAC